MDTLGYVHDITLTYPSLYGLNSMLDIYIAYLNINIESYDICNQFAKNNHVIFNTKDYLYEIRQCSKTARMY